MMKYSLYNSRKIVLYTATTLSTMGAEKLAPALGKLLYDTDKVADLTAEQKQTISNVLGTAGLVTGVVTAQATGADSISSVSAGQQVQGSVQNAVENNNEARLEVEREAAWILADGDRDKYFELISLQGQGKIVMQSIESAHWRYNDMTIINVSGGVAGYTIVINNKNGKLFTFGHPDINVSQLASILSAGASVNFGSIVGGFKGKDEIDKIIEGPSFATQVCKVLCVGRAVTPSGTKINTYGVGINIGYDSKRSGASGAGASGSTMKKTNIILTPQQIKQLLGGQK